MKNKVKILLCIEIIIVITTAFLWEFCTGHINEVTVKNTEESQVYSEKDMDEAVNALKWYFFLHMRGFKLEEIRYAESRSYPVVQEYVRSGKIKNVECMIIFETDYVKIHEYVTNNAFNEKETGYQWTLIRSSAAGKWKVDMSLSGEG